MTAHTEPEPAYVPPEKPVSPPEPVKKKRATRKKRSKPIKKKEPAMPKGYFKGDTPEQQARNDAAKDTQRFPVADYNKVGRDNLIWDGEYYNKKTGKMEPLAVPKIPKENQGYLNDKNTKSYEIGGSKKSKTKVSSFVSKEQQARNDEHQSLPRGLGNVSN